MQTLAPSAVAQAIYIRFLASAHKNKASSRLLEIKQSAASYINTNKIDNYNSIVGTTFSDVLSSSVATDDVSSCFASAASASGTIDT